MELAYGAYKILEVDIPRLKHKNDGLIFTSSVAGYKPGTYDKMYVVRDMRCCLQLP